MSNVEFNVHSSCYSDFFLLRTPITINGHPAVIKVVNGEPLLRVVSGISVRLSAILQQAVAPVVTKHGVYQVDNFYYEQVALFSMKFQSKSSLKQFLTDKEAVQKELMSAINTLFEEKIKSSKQPQSSEVEVDVHVETKVYLVSLAIGRPPEVHQLNLVNHSFMLESWKRSKLFDFNNAMFTAPPPSKTSDHTLVSTSQANTSQDVTNSCPATQETNNQSDGGEHAELAALQVELRGVTEWFSLGVQLSIPTDELMVIRKDHRFTYDCRLEMLIRWEQLEKPSWSKLVTALVNIGRRDLAMKIANKYGVPLPTNVATHFHDEEIDETSDSGPAASKKLSSPSNSGKSLSVLEDEVERATQSRDALTKALEMDIDTNLPELQMKVSSLSQDVRLLKTELKNREEENQMLKEAQQSLKKWNEAIQRTRKENMEAISVLREEIKNKEDELAKTRAQLVDKEQKLSQKMEELDVKSARVCELQTELEEMQRKFNNHQEEMDQKLIESEALAQSREQYLEQIEIQRDIAMKEASKKKEEVQSYTKELMDKEEQISQLSEKIAMQEREMAKLREELEARLHTSEQLLAEENDEKEQQLLTLMMSAMKLQLELRKNKEKKNQDKMNLEEAKSTVEKYQKIIEHSNQEGDVHLEERVTSEVEKNLEMANSPSSSDAVPVNSDPCSQTDAVLTNEQGVVALYDFTGQEDLQLSFKKGDVLQVSKTKYTDWWYGVDSQGRKGFIPANYIRVKEFSRPSNDSMDTQPVSGAAATNKSVTGSNDSKPVQPPSGTASNDSKPTFGRVSTYKSDPEGNYAQALYDFTGIDDEELSFKANEVILVTEKDTGPGAKGWWYAKNSDGSEGYIPVSYVNLISGPRIDPKHSQLQFDNIQTECNYAVALRDSNGFDDECNVNFKADEIIQVIEKDIGPGWVYARNSSGRRGYSLATYFRVIKDIPMLNWRAAKSAPCEITRTVDAVVDQHTVYFNISHYGKQRIFAYESISNTWCDLPDTPTENCSIAVINNMLTTISGIRNGVGTNQLFSLVDKKWVETLPPMSKKERVTRTVRSGTHLIVAGASYSSSIQVLDTTSLKWHSVADQPHLSASLHSLVVCGNYLYLIYDNNRLFRCSTNILVQSTKLNAQELKELKLWDELNNSDILPESTYIEINGHLVAVGGSGPTTSVRMHYSSKWLTIGNMETPRQNCVAAVLPNNRVLVAGGYTSAVGTATMKVETANI